MLGQVTVAKFNVQGLKGIQSAAYCKDRQVSKASKVQLTFIGCSGTNHSTFNLYTATSVRLSATLSYVHAQV